MPLEFETDHPAKLFLLLRSHDRRTDLLKGQTVGVCAHGGVFLQGRKIRQLIPACIRKQGESVIENGRWCNNLSGMVVPENAKVSEVTVLIVDQGVKHQHTAELFSEICSHAVIVVQTLLNRDIAADDPSNGNI